MNSDVFLPYTKLDKNLVDYIMSDLPSEYKKIEIAIYLYIKLAKTLSYENEYYIFDGDSKVAKKHENINNVKNINLLNNEVVCYEFTAIFAKLLDLFNIDFLVKYKKGTNTFGGQHTNLTFEADNFLVYADSVTSILDGDLFRSKIGYSLVGIQCKNNNINMKRNFDNILNKVYNKIPGYNYNELINKCRDKTSSMDIENKIIYFSDLANSIFKNSVDSLAFMLFLKKQILSLEEITNCNMLIVKNNYINDKYLKYSDQLAFPAMIIEINMKDSRIYYVYVSGYKVQKISQDNLRMLFEIKNLEYKVDNPKRLKLIYK